MRDKSPLLLMEQVLMILVFALAAAVCLRAFALSHELSRQSEARDSAVMAAQNTAEAMKHRGGAAEDAFAAAAELIGGELSLGNYRAGYDENWNVTAENAVYTLEAAETAAAEGLTAVELRVWDDSGEEREELFGLTVVWQEVPYGG